MTQIHLSSVTTSKLQRAVSLVTGYGDREHNLDLMNCISVLWSSLKLTKNIKLQQQQIKSDLGTFGHGYYNIV